MTGELQVFNTDTGEVIRAVAASDLLAAAGLGYLPDAGSDELAEFTDSARQLKSVATEAQGIVSDELIRRMDMDGRWTIREGRYEIKGASPDAGTLAYDVEKLRAALADLVTDKVITAKAAHAAVEITRPTAPVPYPLLRRVHYILTVGNRTAAIADEVEQLLLAEPEPTYTVRLVGVKALLKIPAAREAITACQITVDPPRRVARVKRAQP